MKQTSRIISTYSADPFGVCSALFELGGMVIMHDASGCNSTYTTHDEPRWYDMDSMVYISGLTEMEAIMGDDGKLIDDIVEAAEELQPRFIALAGTPIPAMTGFDYVAVAELIEERTGISSFGFATTGMNTYVNGASMALEGIARRLVKRDVEKTDNLSVNILGLTPLDFSLSGADKSFVKCLEEAGFEVISKWAMGSTLEQLAEAGRARVNLVVSSTGLAVAKAFNEMFGTPYVIGAPFGSVMQEAIIQQLRDACSAIAHVEFRGAIQDEEIELCDYMFCMGDAVYEDETCMDILFSEAEVAIIGEGVLSLSLAQAVERHFSKVTKVLCTTEFDKKYLREQDCMAPYEEDIIATLEGVKFVIADPLYKPVCPEGAQFIPLPAESFSGRIFRKEIPDLVYGFEEYFRNYF
ncbi:MAG: oxidoreductase [Firmicutes bacterium]|nr:oxidoreductase [Bacillota bacterium]